MSKFSKFFLLTVISIAFIFSACTDLNTGTSSEVSENKTADEQIENPKNAENETASASGMNEATGLCVNEYYPIYTDKNREYKITGDDPATYILSQNKNEGDSFTEKRKFTNGTAADTELLINWKCTQEGLRNAEYNSGANFSGGNFKMETVESSGVTIPNEWEVGKKWTSSYKVNARLNVGKMSGGAKGTITINNEITSLDDKIQTPDGEFEAAKVVSDMNMNLSGRKMKMTMTNWYARDVGLVKQKADTPFSKSSVGLEYVGEAK